MLEKLKIHKFRILIGVFGVLVFGGAVFGAYKLGQRQAKPMIPTLLKLTPTPAPLCSDPCPQFMPPHPDSCKDGTLIPGEKDECGCQMPPRCERSTADWKSYTNTKYGYLIKYPPNYFISTTVNRIELAHNKWKDQVVHHPFVSVEVFETKSSIDEWVGREIKEKREDGYGVFEEVCDMHCVSATAKEIRIGGNIRALQYSVWGVSGGGDYIVEKKGDTSNWLVVIESHVAGARDPGEESVPKDILDEMLSTFRFLPST